MKNYPSKWLCLVLRSLVSTSTLGLAALAEASTTFDVETRVMAPGVVNDGGPGTVRVKSQFYGFESAINRDFTAGQPAYDYSCHLLRESSTGKYRLYTGGRWRDVDTRDGDGSVKHDGDHIFGWFAAAPGVAPRAGGFLGPLDFSPNTPRLFSGQTLLSPLWAWGTAASSPSIGNPRRNGDPARWWIGNTMEPEAMRVGQTYYLWTQVQVTKGDRLNDTAGFSKAAASADRIQLYTAEASNPGRFRALIPGATDSQYGRSRRGVVVNLDQPTTSKLTHHELIYVPDDADGRPFWMYIHLIRPDQPVRAFRLRSEGPGTFDWALREQVYGFSQLGNQTAYADLANGSRVFVRITFTALAGGRTVPTLNFSMNGLRWYRNGTSNQINLTLAGSDGAAANQNVYFLGLSTEDGTGRLRNLGNPYDDTFHAYFCATTSQNPTAPAILSAEIGQGELMIEF